MKPSSSGIQKASFLVHWEYLNVPVVLLIQILNSVRQAMLEEGARKVRYTKSVN